MVNKKDSSDKNGSEGVDRRTFLKLSAAAGAAMIVSPAVIAAHGAPSIISARGEQPIKIGVDNTLTGTYAADGRNEMVGMNLAVKENEHGHWCRSAKGAQAY